MEWWAKACRQKYKPEFIVKLIGSTGKRYEGGISLPLYYTGFVRSFLLANFSSLYRSE
jgi:hypothetical protein